jgi:HK97 gp10 family phage protein
MASSVRGMRTALRRLRELPLRMNSTRNDALDEWATEIKKTAKELAPKRTGALARSIESRVNTSSGRAWVRIAQGRTQQYALYVEKGTSKMRAQPYLGPAAQIHRRTGERAVRRAASRWLRAW